MSGILSRDQALAFERWELPQVGEVPPEPEPEPAPPPPGPTVAELEAIERQAREEGYAAGLAEGRAAAKLQLDERLARLEAILQAAARPLAALDDATEQELARLAAVMAQRVVGRELALDPALIERAVRAAAAALPAATRELRVWVHPDDMNLLRELAAAEPAWKFGANPALKRGDCVLESPRSRLDATLDTRLAAVIDAVLGNDGHEDRPEAAA